MSIEQGKKRHIGLLVSGGLDSLALVYFFLEKKFAVWPIYVKCNLGWEKAEIIWLKKALKSVRSPRLRPLAVLPLSLGHAYDKNWSRTGKTPSHRSSDASVFLPARNLLMATQACLFLYAKNVSRLAFGTLKGNPFQDGNRSYFRLLGSVLSKSFGRPIQVIGPFLGKTKKDIALRFQHLDLASSFSCINPKGLMHCGICNKCAERKKAFRAAGIKDRTVYAKGVLSSGMRSLKNLA